MRAKIVVSGTLVRKDGSPADGVSIAIHRIEGPRIIWDLDGKGTVTNPSAVTDAKGRFRIELDQAFLAKSREITLLKGFSQLKNSKGIPVTFVLDDQTQKVDAGTITIE